MKYYHRPISLADYESARRKGREIKVGAPHYGVPYSEPFPDLKSIPLEYHFQGIYEIDPVKTINEFGQDHPAKGITHKYYGPLILDIDTNKNETLDDAFEKLKCVIKLLHEEFQIKHPTSGVNIYFSGKKGYHIEIDPGIFGLDKTEFIKGLPYVHKRLLIENGFNKYVDMSRYLLGRGPSIRIANRPRLVHKNGTVVLGVCKVLLKENEIFLGPDTHQELSKHKRNIEPSKFSGFVSNRLSEVFRETLDKISTQNKASISRNYMGSVMTGLKKNIKL